MSCPPPPLKLTELLYAYDLKNDVGNFSSKTDRVGPGLCTGVLLQLRGVARTLFWGYKIFGGGGIKLNTR